MYTQICCFLLAKKLEVEGYRNSLIGAGTLNDALTLIEAGKEQMQIQVSIRLVVAINGELSKLSPLFNLQLQWCKRPTILIL